MFGAGEEREYQITKERDELKVKNEELFTDATNFGSITELVRNTPHDETLGKHVRQLVKKAVESANT